MRLLLDTHVFLWAVGDSPRLASSARQLIEQAEQTYVSAASIWEIAIKAALKKIDADPAELARAIGDSGFLELPVRATHAAGVAKLPLHRLDVAGYALACVEMQRRASGHVHFHRQLARIHLSEALGDAPRQPREGLDIFRARRRVRQHGGRVEAQPEESARA